MQTLLSYASSTLVLCAVAFVAGGVLWPKLVDKVTGVPAGFRTAMNNLEAKAKADVKSAVADVFAKLNPAPVAPPAPPKA